MDHVSVVEVVIKNVHDHENENDAREVEKEEDEQDLEKGKKKLEVLFADKFFELFC